MVGLSSQMGWAFARHPPEQPRFLVNGTIKLVMQQRHSEDYFSAYPLHLG